MNMPPEHNLLGYNIWNKEEKDDDYYYVFVDQYHDMKGDEFNNRTNDTGHHRRP